MKHIGEVTETVLFDLARRIADYRLHAAEASLTDAIEARRSTPGRIAFLRRETENARRNRAALLSIPEFPK